ncbi:MAG: alpha-L-arabinofuranosidase, partial [Prevotella sp.]|nr:alpha-L-arabinofuranosidase [Prevotella sp.]
KQYIVKIVNTSAEAKDIEVTFKGVKTLPAGKVTTLHSDDPMACNTIKQKNNIVPQSATITPDGNVLRIKVPAKTFAVYSF